MKKVILSIALILFIILTVLNIVFFVEISKNKDLKDFYMGKELPDNYSEREKLHMEEVKSLTNISLVLNLISLSIIIFLRKTKINFKKIGNTLIIISILFFVGALFYKTFHHYFHLIMFRTDTWLLPSESILIKTYPLEFFKSRFILINSFILIVGLVLRNVGFSLKRFFQKPQRNK
ncbi:DUF1461 domain-containing protein [Candidatus Woesearchaeota archaeon]|jgi:integral membrane protein (TIGR01906 family)|nr:DUF1461 domain-containing protein [Candidatus Woesearchaeota archaeon]MBT4321655.1 DUF1461 domain-containing protein [Candidatus Woesearchaeota archaeon]MBT4631034.1 DUF1461 domain-containing protein [Candidatus Woesearchaeota archaeon]